MAGPRGGPAAMHALGGIIAQQALAVGGGRSGRGGDACRAGVRPSQLLWLVMTWPGGKRLRLHWALGAAEDPRHTPKNAVHGHCTAWPICCAFPAVEGCRSAHHWCRAAVACSTCLLASAVQQLAKTAYFLQSRWCLFPATILAGTCRWAWASGSIRKAYAATSLSWTGGRASSTATRM